MKLRRHSSRSCLCSAVKNCSTNSEQIFFRKSLQICLSASQPTTHSTISLVVIGLSYITMARLSSIFSSACEETGRPGQRSIRQRFPAFSKRVNLRKPYALLFHGLVHFRGRFPWFKVKYNYACSSIVAPCRNFLHTKQTFAYFDGDETTGITETSVRAEP